MDHQFVTDTAEPGREGHRVPVADQRDGGQRRAVEQVVESGTIRALLLAKPADTGGWTLGVHDDQLDRSDAVVHGNFAAITGAQRDRVAP